MSERTSVSRRPGLVAREGWSETARITELVRRETVGGFLLLVAPALAFVAVNLAARSSDSVFMGWAIPTATDGDPDLYERSAGYGPRPLGAAQ